MVGVLTHVQVLDPLLVIGNVSLDAIPERVEFIGGEFAVHATPFYGILARGLPNDKPISRGSACPMARFNAKCAGIC